MSNEPGALTASSTIVIVQDEGAGGAGYAPGACNIGPEEIAQRRVAALFAGAAAVGLWAGLAAVGAPAASRALVSLPAAGAAISYLQVRNRFCVAYGTRGVYNVEGPVGRATEVEDAVSRRLDRARAARMIAQGAAIGALLGIVAVLVP